MAARRRGANPDAGDTLIEVLLALVVLGLASVALIIAFDTSFSASADHRNLVNYNTMLTTATQEAIFAIQNDTSVWQACSNISTYPTISLPAPYASYSVDYATSTGSGSPTVQYWNGSGFSTTCPSNVASASQLLTIGIVGTHYTNSFVVASPLSISGTSASTGSANGLVFTTEPGGALAGIPFTTQPVLEVESNGYPVTTDLSPVTLTITSSGAAVTGCSGSETNGVISFSGCTIGTAGTYTITATDGTLTAISDTIVVGTADYHLVFTTQPAGGVSGTAFATSPQVTVENSAGITYTAWTGQITLTDSGGALACPGDASTLSVTVTAVNGVATLPTSPSTCTFAGGYLYNPVSNVTLATPYTMTATASGSAPAVPATSNTFAVSKYGAATQLVFTTEPTGVANSNAMTVFTGQPVVTVEDSFGNTVTAGFSGTITLAISSPEGLAGCTYGSLTYGVATFTGCHGTSATGGIGFTLTASTMATGVSSAVSSKFNITGPATQLIFTTQPMGGLSGQTLATQPVLTYEDASGTVVTSSTSSITLTASGGTLSTCTGLAPSQGVVTVANCSFSGKVGQLYYLTATGGGLTATSNAFWVTGAGVASQLVFVTQPIAGLAGSNFTTQPVIDIEDAAGNLETSLNSTIGLSASGGTLTGCTGLSAISGVVQVANCNFGGLVGTQYTLTATDGSITQQSANFSPSGPGPTSQIVLSGCSTPINAGTTCTLTADLDDAYGNVETGDSSSQVTFAEQTGTGTVTGLSAPTVGSGVATDVLTGSVAGPVNLVATGDSLTSNVEALTVYSTSNISVVSTTGTPSVVGQPVTYTATVTPTSSNPAYATGNVEFFDGGTGISGCTTQPLSGTATDTATCTLTYASTSGSPHSITAQYLGNTPTYFAASAVSSSITQNVNVDPTSTSVISTTGSPTVVGQAVTYTATVTAAAPGSGNPTGNVEFFDGGVTIGTCTARALSGTATDTATCTVTYNATGAHTITAQYLGSAGAYSASAVSASIIQVVGAGSTVTTVTSSDLTAVTGQSITYTATVSATSPSTGNPTGNVEFFDGGVAIGTCTAKALTGTSSDTATCVVSYASTTPSSHTITAQYLGSAGTYNASAVSPSITETVSAASTTTAIASSDTTAVPGQTITYTATVSVTAPGTGTPSAADTLTFKDGASTITCGAGSVAFNGTTATCTVVYASTTPATHSITAVFGGDANYSTSTSSTLTESVGKASTTTAIASSDTTAVPGQTITYTATVSVTAPGTGTPSAADTLTFKDGASTITCGAGSVAFNGTTATCTVVYASTTPATHSITAVFGGDANYSTSTSSTLTESVGKAATTTAVTSGTNPSVVGQSVTLTATVSVTAPGAGNPSGTVEFYNGGTAISGCTASTLSTTTEKATCATSFAASGTDTITAVYSGDTTFTGSTSPNLSQTISTAATSTTVVSTTGSPSVVGQAVTYTATVTATAPGAGNPTGSVEFFDGGTGITGCTAKALSGTAPDTATCTITYSAAGSHTITAQYLGNAGTYNASAVSASITQVVGASNTATTVASTTGSPSVVGQAVTYTATVTATAPGTGNPTGNVEFFDGGTAIGSCTAQVLTGTASDTATCTVTYNVTGSHTITAQYLGSAGAYNASAVSASITQTVNRASTTTGVTSSSAPSVVGQKVTYTATVAVTAPGAGTPPSSDTVTFKDGVTTITCGSGSVAFNGTTATCTVTYANTVGSPHSITAVFGGDANYNGSTSSADSQVVNAASTTTSVLSNDDPSTAGQTVTYTATVSVNAPGAGTPPSSDTVTFKDGVTTITCGSGSVAFNGTTATCTVTYANTVGSPHSITAVFGGDANFATSTATADIQTVNANADTTAVTSGTNPTVVGQATTLTATITPTVPGSGNPSGTVQFLNGGVTITGCGAKTVSTVTETATCSFAAAASGSDSITAIYSGDTVFLGSTSPAITQTVNNAATTATVVSTTGSPAVVGQAVTYTATVAASAPSTGNPTGSVEFFDGGTAIGTCTAQALSGTAPDTATCVITYASTTGSPHTITAQYLGSAGTYIASAVSTGITQAINTAGTTTTVVSTTGSPTVVGQAVTYTATVTATAPSTGHPTGNVEFFDGGTAIGACTAQALSGGTPDTATCTVTYSAPGTHTITAQYLGLSLSYSASAVSASITQTVNMALTTTSLTSNHQNGRGLTVTYTATVAVTAPGVGTPPATDAVEFEDNGTPITGCMAQPLSGTSTDTATCSATYGNGFSSHTITAIYSGDANFTTSTSPGYTETE